MNRLCACHSSDRRECFALREGYYGECWCECHDEEDVADEEPKPATQALRPSNVQQISDALTFGYMVKLPSHAIQ